MPHGFQERFRGSPSAVATYVQIPAATSVVLAGTNANRDICTILADIATVSINFGAIATNTLNIPLAAGGLGVWNETSYIGPIYGSVPSGASGGAFVVDIGGGETDH